MTPDPRDGGMTDPLGADALRQTVLDAWLASPTRFREDANLEEDHARGHYRDRVVVELAQNAADAAMAAGVPGEISLELRTEDAVLVVRGPGAPLDAAGAAALAGMRASAKRDGTSVGRFGVGFSAVRSVSDDVTIASGPLDHRADVGLTFSLERSRAVLAQTVAAAPEPGASRLAAAVAERGDDLPALRLPFAAMPADCGLDAPESGETVVVLRIRPESLPAVQAAVDAVDDTLLLALPGLSAVDVTVDGATRHLADVEDRWVVVRDVGDLPDELVADRPVEQRGTHWSVTWALPRSGRPPGVVHAPTPTDDVSSLPALLVATFPVDPGRRRTTPGPVTDALVERAAACYPRLVGRAAEAGRHPLDLVPVGLPGSELDARLHAAIVAAVRDTPVLDSAGVPVAPQDARCVIGGIGEDPDALALLASGTPDLVAVPSRCLAAARTCGVTVVDLADVVGALPDRDPARWRDAYEVLARWVHEPGAPEAMATLSVPLRDGRTVHGPRGVLLPHGRAVEIPGVRLVHPAAAHPLLERLGARPADAFDALNELGLDGVAELESSQPEFDAPPAERLDAEDGPGLDGTGQHDTVDRRPLDRRPLDLVAAALADRPDLDPADAPFWWGELEVETDDGPLAARDCVIPDSWADGVLDLEPVAEDEVERYGADLLRAIGVAADVTVLRVPHVLTPDDGPDLAVPAASSEDGGPADWLDGWSDYLDELAARLGESVAVGTLTAVADLDVADLGPMVARIAANEDARAATVTPVRPDNGGGRAPSYTAWWLRAAVGGPFALPGAAVPLLGAVPDVLAGLDETFLVACGGVSALADLDDDAWRALLDDLPAVGESVEPAVAVEVWDGLAAVGNVAVGRLPALLNDRLVMTARADVVAAATPCWAQVRAVVPATLAASLDIDSAPDRAPDTGDAPERVDLDPGLVEAVPGIPTAWWAHEDLTLDGAPVAWWVHDGQVHATTTSGLAQGLAAAAGRWEDRHRIELLLAEPDRAAGESALSAWD